jgi:ribonuclease BN (tRNA processing enzyme)
LYLAPHSAVSADHSLELLVLGSGGPGATGRAASSYVLLLDETPRILVDAGPGAFVRLGEAKVALADLDLVLLTHLHVDHVAELPGIIKARAVSGIGPIEFDIYGPTGSAGGGGAAVFPSTRRFVSLLFGGRGAYAYLQDFASPVTLRAHDLEIHDAQSRMPHKIVTRDQLAVTEIAGHHGDAPAVAYRIDYAGKSVVFSGDMDPAGLASLRTLAKGADLLVFDCAVLDPPQSPQVLYALHSPPRRIGEVAQQAGVRAVLLSHLSPAIDGAREAVRASIAENFKGPVRFAEDNLRLRP